VNTPASSWSAEQIDAFVDGQLDPATAAQIEAAMVGDAAFGARIAQQRELRARLAGAFDAVLDEPVPARLLQALDGRSGGATAIGAARSARTRLVAPRPLWWSAAAASVLVAALIGWNLPRDPGGVLIPEEGALLAAGALEEALSRRVSGDARDTTGITVALSFITADGRYCRAFSLDSGLDGLACRGNGRWEVEATGRAPARPAEEYRQASSTLSAPVLAAISLRQAGDALTPDEESRLRDGGWQ
jgi:hypothetical protein